MKNTTYKIPVQARIGHVHLKVSNLDKSLKFYCGLLGFELITKYGNEAAFISAGGYHHHIGLNVWYSKNAPPANQNSVGLFHTAILYPTRKALALILSRLQHKEIPFGASDHGVSEAIYINDPDKNGVELYCDRPKNEWPRKKDGSIEMYTIPLDINDLSGELD